MNAIDHAPATLLNVVVFSNFPENVFENEIRNKLLDNRVNVIRVYKPDRVDACVADMSEADAALVFIDFMSHSQDDLIRKKARACGKPIIALRRQTSSEWPKLLETVMPKPKSFGQFLQGEREKSRVTIKDVAEKTRASVADVKAWEADEKLPTGSQMSRLRIIFNKIAYHPSFRSVPVAENDEAPESLPSGVKQAMHTFMSLTMAGVGEDEILQSMKDISDLKEMDQIEDMFDRYVKTDLAPNEFRAWWEDYQKSKTMPLPPPSVPPSLRVVPPAPPSEPAPVSEPSEVEVLESQLHDAKTMEAMYEEELRKARDEAASLKEQLQKTFKQFQGAQGAKAAADQRHEAEATRLRAEAQDAEQRHVAARALLKEVEQRATLDLSVAEACAEDAHKARKETENALAIAQKELAELKLAFETAATEFRQQLDAARAERAAHAGDGKLDKIASSLKSLVAEGVLTREEAGAKFAKHLFGAPTGEKP